MIVRSAIDHTRGRPGQGDISYIKIVKTWKNLQKMPHQFPLWVRGSDCVAQPRSLRLSVKHGFAGSRRRSFFVLHRYDAP